MGRYSFTNEIMKTICLNLLDFVWFHLISFNYFEHNPINDIINSFRWCQKYFFCIYLNLDFIMYTKSYLIEKMRSKFSLNWDPLLKKNQEYFNKTISGRLLKHSANQYNAKKMLLHCFQISCTGPHLS